MSTKPDFEFSMSQPVEVEFYEPFVKTADEETLASRIRKLHQQRLDTVRALASCRSEIATWAMRERHNRMRLDDIDNQLTELGAA